MNTNRTHLRDLTFHVLLGILAKFVPIAFSAYFLIFVVNAAYRIINTSDRNMLAGRYVLYVAGLEIVYRVSGFTPIYELGKYSCMLLLLIGLQVGRRRSYTKPFLVYILLLLPAIVITALDFRTNTIRNTVMFSLSGPLVLGLSGMYFLGRTIQEHELWQVCRKAVLPGVSLIVILTLGPSVESVEFTAESNFALSGGFGPNQVSTSLGFFAMLLVFSSWNGQVLTLNRLTDYLLISLFIYRAIITFSRGGVLAFALSVLGTVIAMLFISNSFRKNIFKYSFYIAVLAFTALSVFSIANNLTDDWLLYRYKGVSTYEVMTGIEKANHSYLSGREKIADQELELFKDNWLIGVGAGMSKVVRESTYRQSLVFASHSEFSRLLAEHGVLGVIALFLIMVWLPFKRIRKSQSDISKQFFFLFFLMGVLTMAHAAMRLALPGVIVGFSFAFVIIPLAINIRASRKIVE